MRVTATYSRDGKSIMLSFPEQWNADHIQANSITTDRLTVGIHPNLLKSKYTDYQSFANNAVIGSGVANGTALCDTGNFYIGDRCLEMIASAADNYVYLGSSATDYNIRLEASTKYILSCYAMASSGTPSIAISIKQDDAAALTPTPASRAITTSWARYQFIVTTDANLTDSGLLRIDNDTNGATVYFDAIQVEKASDATSPEAQPYTPSGTVEIYGGQIEAASITTTQIAATTILAGNIAANTITAAEIAAGTITATEIKGTGFGTLTITSGKIVINVADALEIGGSGNINLLAGGDVTLAPSDSNPALLKWSTGNVISLGAASTAGRGLCTWPAVDGTEGWKIGWDPVNNAKKAFSSNEIHGNVIIFGNLNISGAYLLVGDYIGAVGGVHVGGTSDPGTDNLLVDGTSTFRADITVQKGTPGSDTYPILYLKNTDNALNDSDNVGIVYFTGYNSTPALVSYVYITAEAMDVTATTEDGYLRFNMLLAGDNNIAYTFAADGTAWADVEWSVTSPDIVKDKGIENPTSDNYLDWALEDAEKPVKPYKGAWSNKDEAGMAKVREAAAREGVFSREDEKKKFSKGLGKISIGTARWAKEAREQINFLKTEITRFEGLI